MAQTSNRFLDDLARLMTDAAGAAQGVRREVETVFKGQIERMLQDMNVPTREEVDVLRDMVVAAREENERLAIRMKALEERLGEERLAGREGHGAPAGGPAAAASAAASSATASSATASSAASPTAAQSESAPGFIE